MSRASIADHIQTLVDKNAFIESREQMQQELEKTLGVKVEIWKLGQIMREDLGLRYKKIKQISLHDNSVKNLVLR